jgi:hypothetical protein
MGKPTIPRNRFTPPLATSNSERNRIRKEELQDLQYCKLMKTYLLTLPLQRRRTLADRLIQILHNHV